MSAGERLAEVFCRIILGGIFLFSGIVKSIDPVGTAIKIGEYLHSFGITTPDGWHLVLACVLCAFETMLGFMMFAGIYRRTTAWLMWLTMSFMTMLTLYIWIANPVADCGCFGDALKISNGATFGKNVFLMIPATFLLVYRRRLSTFLPPRLHTLQAGIALLAVLLFILNSVVHLPAIDFRPYKVGISLLKERQEGRAESVNDEDYLYVYEKNGVEKEFTLSAIDQVDSTWTYVRQEVKASENLPIATTDDFRVYNARGEEISDSLVAPGKKVALVLSPNLKEVNISSRCAENLQEFNRIVQRAGGTVRLVVGEKMSAVADRTLACLSPFAPVDQMDPSTLWTMIRSNPGVIILNDGVIARKVSRVDLLSLMKKESFVQDPFKITTPRESRIRVLKSFSPLFLGLLSFIVLAVWGKRSSRRGLVDNTD